MAVLSEFEFHKNFVEIGLAVVEITVVPLYTRTLGTLVLGRGGAIYSIVCCELRKQRN